MDFVGRRFMSSTLLVAVAFLALVSVSPVNTSTALGTALRTASATPHYAHSGQAPAYPHTEQAPTYAHTAQAPTYAHTEYRAQNPTTNYAHTAQNSGRTYSYASYTMRSRTWSQTWSTTWSRRTHVYPTYTSTEYVPIQVQGCDPYDPSCNGYSGYYGYYPTPGCDPSNPYCSGYYGYYQTPACDPSNPYCNPALQTPTAYQQASQTTVANQPPQTVTPYQPQTLPVTRSQTQNLTPLLITITVAAAAAVLLISRKSRQTTPTQPIPVSSPALPNSAAQSGLLFCTQCGKQIRANSRFCRFCGSAQ